METRLLGQSGLPVPVLSFGTMTFGGQSFFAAMGNTQDKEATQLISICLDAGCTLFDTADVYSQGRAEEVLGAALRGRRHEALIATKAFARMGPRPHDAGLSRQHLIEACEASLRRLGTDYIDLYQSHGFDSLVPIDETLRAFDDLVRQGKVRYIGCSNFSGWHLMKAQAIAERDRLPRYVGQQINYSLLAREAEHELIPLGLDQGIGVLVWSPLHFGLLSGKYRRNAPAPEGRLQELEAPGTVDEARLYRIVDALDDVSKMRNVSVAQVALNWLLRKPSVDTVIFGARNEDQLRDNLAAASWDLSTEEVQRLDEVSALPEPYPYWHQHKYGIERNPRLPGIRNTP
jgi:aryl-alcohol dehydrogenase-like predicted oxidoreductase